MKLSTDEKLPRFLTKDLAAEAVKRTLGLLLSFPEIETDGMHAVIIVKKLVTVKGGKKKKGQPSPYRIEPHILYEHSVGKRKDWSYDYKNIAKCKAMQLFDGFADGELRIRPHLLLKGDTQWVGGVVHEQIVVAWSGATQNLDRMLSTITASICIALAQDVFDKSDIKKEGITWV